ncbi:MAG: cupredoxin domain-containing protein [Actinobacteria bacterium]|nr:cupredoxin domain-containing protein [Actinomycetota bacterium]
MGVFACGLLLSLAAPAHALSGSGHAAGAPPAVVHVAIAASGFDPSTLSIPAGTTVLWVNNDTVAHTVTAADGSFASDDLGPGDTFSYQFTQLGTVAYHDIHGNFQAVVTVVPGSVQNASVPNASAAPGPEALAPAVGAAPANRAGGPTMAFTGTGDWILAATAAVLLLLGGVLLRRRPATATFRLDRNTALTIERARRRREEFLPRRRRVPRLPRH